MIMKQKKIIALFAIGVLLTLTTAFVLPRFFAQEQTAQKDDTVPRQTVSAEPQIPADPTADISAATKNEPAASAPKCQTKQSAQSDAELSVTVPSQSSTDNAVVEFSDDTEETLAEETATEPSGETQRLQINDIKEILPNFGTALPTVGSDGYYNAVIKP